MEIVSNPGLFDLYSDEKGLRLFAYREVDTYMYLPNMRIRGVSDVPPRDKVE